MELHHSSCPVITIIQTVSGSVKAAAEGFLINDLEPPAFACEPRLMALKRDIAKHLLEGAEGGVMMSGSGDLQCILILLFYSDYYILGTSVYALITSSEDVNERQRRQMAVEAVLASNPGVRHFQCSYLRKTDDEKHWYTI